MLEQGAAPRQQAATYQRVSALNLASQRLLSHIGAWPAIASSAAAYSQMQVWDADSFARIAFDAQTEGVAALGHICDNEQIRLALYQQLQQQFSQQQWAELAYAAHSLKGSAGSMGYPELTQLSGELEVAANKQQQEACSQLLAQIQQMVQTSNDKDPAVDRR